jgi:hypothetical protein
MSDGWSRVVEGTVSVFKYLVAIYMMVAGLATPWIASGVETANHGWLYSSPVSLTIIGTIIFLCGLTLFIGKVRRSKSLIGNGLMACFCCFVFAGVLNSMAFGAFDPGNFVVAAVMGVLYLRWRFKKFYANPNHFAQPRTDRKAHYPPV